MSAIPAPVDVTVIVPTFDEAGNVAELVRRLCAALDGRSAEILFVDDSRDDTPQQGVLAAASASLPVRLIHRPEPTGGLAGAVREGLAASSATWCVVMDGDLQHPPSLVPVLVDTARARSVAVVVASRYVGDGRSDGLATATRRAVSSASTTLTRAMFPRRLAECSDPMTGFFAVRREAVDLALLRPRGFKILLEILARHRLAVAEVPFVFGERLAGDSKASVRQGVHFLGQLAALRFGRMSGFAVVGGSGALLNVGLVWLMTALGLTDLVAALVAAEVTIVTNFLLLERFVFRDLRDEGRTTWGRAWRSFLFNNVETAVRLPLVLLLVSTMHVAAWLATAATLVVAFLARYAFHAQVVYRPRRRTADAAAEVLPAPTVLDGA